MTGRSAVLHIGTEKTGSTSIQAALVAAREALAAAGVWYARAPGERVHDGLAAFARQPGGARGAWGTRVAGADLPGAIAAELAALPSRIGTVVYSSEQLNTRLATPAGVARLHALLAPHFSAFRVVVYLRRQDRRAVSGYTTRLRHGHAGTDLLPDDASWLAKLDYAALLERWAGVFGADAMVPRRFDAVVRDGGDVVSDFWAAAGLPGAPPAALPRRNTALSAAAQEFLRRCNAAALAAGATRDASGRVARAFAPTLAASAGPGRKPDRAAARAYAARFAASNARLAERWFATLATTFDDDFSEYPETVEPPDEAAVAAIAIAAALRLAWPSAIGPAAQHRDRGRVRSAADG